MFGLITHVVMWIFCNFTYIGSIMYKFQMIDNLVLIRYVILFILIIGLLDYWTQ